jgi:hypothetical protein
MYEKFKYESVPLSLIDLDFDNPRIVTPNKLKTIDEIILYLFEHEDLLDFIKTISIEGRNKGAERPYVIANDSRYTVVEGNTRVAAYRILAGLTPPPPQYEDKIPVLSGEQQASFQVIDVTLAPSRASLMPIMARSHFGTGDKARWGYLGSRKAVYDEYKKQSSLSHLAKVFDRPKSDVIDYILEYLLYQEAIKLPWSANELEVLLNPNVMFNPPVRFLETQGHKEKVGVVFDRVNLQVKFSSAEAKQKFRHLIAKLVVSPTVGLSATSTYDEVFSDYASTPTNASAAAGAVAHQGTKTAAASTSASTGASGASATSTPPLPKLKNGALFNYPVTRPDQLLVKLMGEAKSINGNTLPASATFLLRNIIEALLKAIIHQYALNSSASSTI